jgi:hypothetical protein
MENSEPVLLQGDELDTGFRPYSILNIYLCDIFVKVESFLPDFKFVEILGWKGSGPCSTMPLS